MNGRGLSGGDATVVDYITIIVPWVEIRLWPSLQLEGHKGEKFVFLLFLKLCFSFTVAHFMA